MKRKNPRIRNSTIKEDINDLYCSKNFDLNISGNNKSSREQHAFGDHVKINESNT